MLSPKVQLNLKHAKAYFREHLSVGDYYSVEAQVRGEWFGEAAARLGLAGVVGEAEFLALCEGLNPKTGERLTQRLNSARHEALGRELANRRVFYDFTISPPKSVSVVASIRMTAFWRCMIARCGRPCRSWKSSRRHGCGQPARRQIGKRAM